MTFEEAAKELAGLAIENDWDFRTLRHLDEKRWASACLSGSRGVSVREDPAGVSLFATNWKGDRKSSESLEAAVEFAIETGF